MENESLDKIRKYTGNIRNTEIWSFITLTPGVNLRVNNLVLICHKAEFTNDLTQNFQIFHNFKSFIYLRIYKIKIQK